jgi:hypothetical protein
MRRQLTAFAVTAVTAAAVTTAGPAQADPGTTMYTAPTWLIRHNLPKQARHPRAGPVLCPGVPWAML